MPPFHLCFFSFPFLSSSKRFLPHTLPLQISPLWRHFPRTLRSVTERFTIGTISHASPGSWEIFTLDFCTASSWFSLTGQFLLDTFHMGISQCVPLHGAQTLLKGNSIQLAFGESTTNPFRIHYTTATAELGLRVKCFKEEKCGCTARAFLSIPPEHNSTRAQTLTQSAVLPTHPSQRTGLSLNKLAKQQ